jgi:hypothetical protein
MKPATNEDYKPMEFCQQEDVLLRRWLVFQIQGFLPSAKPSNHQAHLTGAQRSKEVVWEPAAMAGCEFSNVNPGC